MGGSMKKRPQPKRRKASSSDDGSCRRMCLTTGRRLHKDAMIRFVVDPHNCLTPDIKGDLPGRGMWITLNKQCLEVAIRKDIFSKHRKTKVIVPKDLASWVAVVFQRRILSLVSLSRRCGFLVTGFENVSALVKAGKASVVFACCCLASYNEKKISTLCEKWHVNISHSFMAEDLGKICNRHSIVFAAVKKCGMSVSINYEMRRLEVFLKESDSAR